MVCRYEIMALRVIHRRRRTGFEETKDFPIRVNDLIAGRYQVPHSPLTCKKATGTLPLGCVEKTSAWHGLTVGCPNDVMLVDEVLVCYCR